MAEIEAYQNDRGWRRPDIQGSGSLSTSLRCGRDDNVLLGRGRDGSRRGLAEFGEFLRD